MAIFLLRLLILQWQVWPINGDEAQYWDWSRHLAWGYYSKPPMVAWVIYVTSAFFGKTALGLRLAATLSYILLTCKKGRQ